MCMHTKFIGVAVTVALSCVVCHGSNGFPEPCNIACNSYIQLRKLELPYRKYMYRILKLPFRKKPILPIYPVFQSIKEVSGLSTSYKPRQQFNN